jgi:hypothetical protein
MRGQDFNIYAKDPMNMQHPNKGANAIVFSFEKQLLSKSKSIESNGSTNANDIAGKSWMNYINDDDDDFNEDMYGGDIMDAIPTYYKKRYD